MHYPDRPYSQRGILALLLVVFGSLAVWASSDSRFNAPLFAGDATKNAPQVRFARDTRLMLFLPDKGQWVLSTFAQAKPGNEFCSNNQLYRVVDSEKAQLVLNVDAGKLLEADLQYQKINNRRPRTGDIVQVLDKNNLFVAHALLDTVQPGAIIRFQGRAYSLKADGSLVSTGTVFSSATSPLQRIEITRSGLQLVMDRHTPSGALNTGKSIFNVGEDIQALIKNAEIAAPVLEENGYLRRNFDAGRNIGIDTSRNRQTSTYRVITTQSGKLVTAYPMVPGDRELYGD
jgi:hypothetical protein